ncbi:LytTR family DNA-binding domain-containing protein [Pedobacter sp. Leaf176]|uniref:LytR/AlgR family response regulator transcription factor n=1 Tax=Pedobacter sp. Leaf176 TaxID=1736286 RepID=UPI0006F6F3B0|nr:response regulator [Pedobacter sp. Leaf176]KQR67266.1 hypothetical protein ASF92_16290 [Pedobacter sp. Leaf176]
MNPSNKQKYSCVILDDNSLSVSILEKIVSDISELELIGSFTDPIMATAAFQELEMVDFLFIDIGMEVSGLDIARMLKNKVNYIVFVTAHEKFAVKAFETGAAYLVKPVDFETVLNTVNQLIAGRNMKIN